MKTPHSSTSLRPLCEDDFEQVIEIEKVSYPEPWTLKHMKSELEKPFARAWVLTDDETDSVVVGYLFFWLQAEGVSLLNITVGPEWRGLGFAQKLMRAMINEAVREDIPRIILEVREGNSGALKLYERLGFKVTNERKKFYKDGETALVMELKTSEVHPVIQ